MSDSDAGCDSDTDRDFHAEPKNGVYLMEIESAHDGYIFYSTTDYTLVDGVRINGNYISTSGSFETECDDFEFTEDGHVNLRYNDTDSVRDAPGTSRTGAGQ